MQLAPAVQATSAWRWSVVCVRPQRRVAWAAIAGERLSRLAAPSASPNCGYLCALAPTSIAPNAAPRLLLSDADRQRLDPSPDGAFYATPRMMHHTDAAWRAQLAGGELL